MTMAEPQPAALHVLLQQQDPKEQQQQQPNSSVSLPALNSTLLGHIKSLDFAFVISDAQHPDMPIVYASDGFYTTTGYSPDEVIGRNCRFLQGPETERQKVMEIRDAIREDRCCQVCLLNYRKDGTTFLNQFFLSPIKNEQGVVTHYVGIQTDVTAAAEAGLLDSPEQLTEQQAAVALGTVAGCKTCDMVMKQVEVQKQLQQHQQQQQQEQQQQQLPPSSAAAAAARRRSLQGVPAVIQVEVTHMNKIEDAFQLSPGPQQQSPPGGIMSLPSSLLQSLLKVQAAFVLADPRLPDCPIVHASPEFLQLTGYSREEVEGRNCRFLQGAGTDPAEVAKVRQAVTADPPKPVTVMLLNYRKDGEPFWNALHIAPVRDAEGVLEYFIGVQLDVTQRPQQQQQQQQQEEGAGEEAAAAEGISDAAPCKLQLRHKMAHMTATGAVRVACRGLSGSHGGLRRSMEDQGLPQTGYSLSVCSKRSSSVSSGALEFGSSFNRAADAAIAQVAASADKTAAAAADAGKE